MQVMHSQGMFLVHEKHIKYRHTTYVEVFTILERAQLNNHDISIDRKRIRSTI